MAEAPKLALVADIGGTNARFALADSGNAEISLHAERVYRTADFPGLLEAIEAYFAEVTETPGAAALAVASPVHGDRIDLTNRAWSFAISDVRRRLGFAPMLVLNDFAAVALSLPHLQPGELYRIGGPQAEESAPVLAVVGPGTGLGVGGLLCRENRHYVIASEGGHTSFAPADDVEIEILRILEARYDHVSFERVLSGPGLVDLYRTMARIQGSQADEAGPAEIVARGIAGKEPLHRAVLDRYCAILGGFAGNVALMFGAGQVFLAGGIVPRFPDFLAQSAFRRRFEAKGRFAALLESVPVNVIRRANPGLLGAAYALRAQLSPETEPPAPGLL